ncbi:uncharacterized protein KY384_002995 [Bacidia gigantensis]|uniref:uncharacterized protein n=1 Tax=Bacidia gigantensis TaxID=2732470 RepID=UPI001D05A964|nr:uncharacterized protein KY384_002995 [Bacidia gigantensis]KAG8531366.1 hypothetical protein KY384_002995 [Bacidia gigantensis]
MSEVIVIGVVALQGAFHEHLKLLNLAAADEDLGEAGWDFRQIRTPEELEACDALIIPGGESTTISLVAARSNLIEPLRHFVKVERKPTWGTCAGLILLAEAANRTKKGGQELIGGLDVRVNRNHFGRQAESFETPLDLPFLKDENSSTKDSESTPNPFNGIFIRAPVVEKLLPVVQGEQCVEALRDDTVIAPSKQKGSSRHVVQPVEVLATLPGRTKSISENIDAAELAHQGDIIVVRQGNVLGTSFHPELTGDARIHVWWLKQVMYAIRSS